MGEPVQAAPCIVLVAYESSSGTPLDIPTEIKNNRHIWYIVYTINTWQLYIFLIIKYINLGWDLGLNKLFVWGHKYIYYSEIIGNNYN